MADDGGGRWTTGGGGGLRQRQFGGNQQTKIYYMEKRVLGISLAILGLAGLILAAVSFMNGGDSSKHIKSLVVYGVLGIIFFFAGIGLVRNTNDKAT